VDEAAAYARRSRDVGNKPTLQLQNVPKPFHVAPRERQVAQSD
jgi:hypothetical protein